MTKIKNMNNDTKKLTLKGYKNNNLTQIIEDKD